MSPLSVGWAAGPRTQIELSYADGKIMVRFAPGFRSTVRIPSPPRPFSLLEIQNILAAFGAGSGNRDGAAVLQSGSQLDLATLGALLVRALPPYVENELDGELYLELGIAENLLGYPWELILSGGEHLCARHNVARYINATDLSLQATRRPSWWGAPIDKLRVLIVSVAAPEPRGGRKYDELSSVMPEAKAVMTTLAAAGYTPSWLDARSFVDVHRAMMATKYHIVHFCGHAEFGGVNGQQGNLVLQKDDMPADIWMSLLQSTDAVVCVMNGCETARQDAVFSGGPYGLARAVLDTGTYLVGSAWKVNDAGAEAFATTFYKHFVGELASIGVSVRLARDACRRALPLVPAWASYVLYGDPRLRFEQIVPAAGSAAGSSTATGVAAVVPPPLPNT